MCFGRRPTREEEAREVRKDPVWERFEREREPGPPPPLVAEREPEREEREAEKSREKVPAGVGS